MPGSGRGFAPNIVAVVAFSSLLAAVLIVAHLALVPQRIPLNYNEGWMAFFSARAVGGGVLYPPSHGFINDNYPPLSFFMVGALGALIGDGVVAGRIAAFVALLVASATVYWSARRLDARPPAAAAGTVLFALFNLTWFHAYVAMADAQWLGQAVSLLALPLLLVAPGEARLPVWRAAVAGLLMVAAGFVKHNLVALPAAAGLWLLLCDRRAFAAWAGAAAAALALGGAVVWSAYGPVAFADVIGDRRRWLFDQWPDAIAYLAPMIPMMVAAAVLARRRGADRRVRLVTGFAAFAVVFSLVQRLGEGVNVNAYFEALAGLAIASAAAIELAPSVWRGRAWGAGAAALVIAAPTLFASPYFLWRAGADVAAIPARRAAWSQVIAAARAAPSPVACEMLSVCYWAGKGFELDFFNYGQELRTGASPEPLRREIAAGGFGAIVLTRDADYAAGRGRLPPPIPAAIEAAYAVKLAGPNGTAVMTPRAAP